MRNLPRDGVYKIGKFTVYLTGDVLTGNTLEVWTGEERAEIEATQPRAHEVTLTIVKSAPRARQTDAEIDEALVRALMGRVS